MLIYWRQSYTRESFSVKIPISRLRQKFSSAKILMACTHNRSGTWGCIDIHIQRRSLGDLTERSLHSPSPLLPTTADSRRETTSREQTRPDCLLDCVLATEEGTRSVNTNGTHWHSLVGTQWSSDRGTLPLTFCPAQQQWKGKRDHLYSLCSGTLPLDPPSLHRNPI